MKKVLTTILRDKLTPIDQFRYASDHLATQLAYEVASRLCKEAQTVTTPLGLSHGVKLLNSVVFIPILRAGLALLHPFLKVFPKARVGMVGMERDEETAEARLYYQKLPKIQPEDEVIILDPMLATGGSSIKVFERLTEMGVKEDKITMVCVISAPQGIERIQSKYPESHLYVVEEDEELTSNFLIYPGLGDYGDRYFGTVP